MAGSQRSYPESYQDLAPKIARHGADEDKHGRIFKALLRKRGHEPVPAETDYTMLLEDVDWHTGSSGWPYRYARRRCSSPTRLPV